MRTSTIIRSAVAVAIAWSGLFVGATASAQSFQSGDSYKVAQSAVHDGSLYTANQTLVVDGTVNGSVYCAGQTVTITGTVNGDVICAAQNITIRGTVNGDVRVAAQMLTVDSRVNGSVTAFVQDATLNSGAVVTGDLNGFASTVNVKGSVQRDVAVAAQDISVAGGVARDVNVQVQTLTIADTARIGGALRYEGERSSTIPDGTVLGKVTYVAIPESERRDSQAAAVQFTVYWGIATAVLVLAYALLLPRHLDTTTRVTVRQGLLCVSAGTVAIIGLPIVAAALASTFVGLFAAWAVGLVWLLVLALGPVYAIYWVGRETTGRWTSHILLRAFGGVLLVGVAYLLPLVGALVWLVSTPLGTGLVIRRMVRAWKRPQYHAPTEGHSSRTERLV